MSWSDYPWFANKRKPTLKTWFLLAVLYIAGVAIAISCEHPDALRHFGRLNVAVAGITTLIAAFFICTRLRRLRDVAAWCFLLRAGLNAVSITAGFIEWRMPDGIMQRAITNMHYWLDAYFLALEWKIEILLLAVYWQNVEQLGTSGFITLFFAVPALLVSLAYAFAAVLLALTCTEPVNHDRPGVGAKRKSSRTDFDRGTLTSS